MPNLMELKEMPLKIPKKLSQRQSIKDVFNFADLDDQGIYDEALQSGEAARTREEKRATDNILGDLQARGLARSGIALRDVAEQVLGPSQERARSLAATFGLERARGRSDFARDLASKDYDFGNTVDLTNLGFLQNRNLQELENEQRMRELLFAQQKAAEERKRQRRSGLSGLAGGGIGALFGGSAGSVAGNQIGAGLF